MQKRIQRPQISGCK